MPLPSEWQPLFSVEAECAATLTGLVFVAVSINISMILSSPGLPGRAGESIAQFLQVFFICTAMLIPQQTATAQAAEISCMVLLSWTLQLITQINYARLKSGHPKAWLVTRVVQTQLGSAPLLIGAVQLLTGSSNALYSLSAGFALSVFAGIMNAWILLIEIHR